MKFLIVLAVAVGMATASPSGFLQNTPEVQAATLNFIEEYNRLAKLAAEAPDIHIYHDDKLQRIQPAPTQHRQQVVNPLQNHQFYSFTANLGGSNQFQPHQLKRSFAQVHHVPVRPPVQEVRHAIQHFPQQQVVIRQLQPSEPIRKWTGPFADTEPAGVRSLPRDVTPTPEVAAARNAHYAILVDAYQRAAANRQHNVV